MNKKLILIIALMVSVVSVILVSVYGKVADVASRLLEYRRCFSTKLRV